MPIDCHGYVYTTLEGYSGMQSLEFTILILYQNNKKRMHIHRLLLCRIAE